MAITIKVKNTDSPDKISKLILERVVIEINKVFLSAALAIRIKIQNMCTGLIENTEEYQSLLSGELLAELGIPNVRDRLHNILKKIKDSVLVEPNKARIQGTQIQGGLFIGMVQNDFEDILALSDSTYVSNQRYIIPWLEWLIMEGDRIIVFNYEVTYALNEEQKARSRTGMALMRPGAGWRVPPEYSGTLDNNFITRAFNVYNVEDYISGIVQREIESRL